MVGTMAIMDKTGDNKIIWDSSRRDEVEIAKGAFDAAKAKGYLAFRVNKDGTKGEVIREFDSEAEKLILAPPVRGG